MSADISSSSIVPSGLAEQIAAALTGTSVSLPEQVEVAADGLTPVQLAELDSWGAPAQLPGRTHVLACPTTVTINRQYELFGMSVCAVLRWAGAQGMQPKDVKKALVALGVVGVSPSTVNCQMVGGRNGSRGKVPMLSDEQAREFCEAAGYEWAEADVVGQEAE